MRPAYLVMFSAEDPVASALWEVRGPGEPTGDQVAGAAVRRWGESAAALRRPGFHVFDGRLEHDLAQTPALAGVPVVFPSVHRSARGVDCFTAHPLGNAGDSDEVGGVPRQLNPAAPRLMTDALRRLQEESGSTGLPATFEATHHGPALDRPSFFVEIGLAEGAQPRPETVRGLARVLTDLQEDPLDRIAVGIGGGHYAPHFTDLALRRHWAFGHLISRHAFEQLDLGVARQVLERTPGCEGALFARAQDAREGAGPSFVPRLADGAAPRRAGAASRSSRDASPTSGT